MGGILAIVLQWVEAGIEVAPYLKKLYEAFDGKEPTKAELDALRAMEIELDSRIEIQLPPDDGTLA